MVWLCFFNVNFVLLYKVDVNGKNVVMNIKDVLENINI